MRKPMPMFWDDVQVPATPKKDAEDTLNEEWLAQVTSGRPVGPLDEAVLRTERRHPRSTPQPIKEYGITSQATEVKYKVKYT
jgi:hypothetical protein